jgi:putative FmdB family regulatory protein
VGFSQKRTLEEVVWEMPIYEYQCDQCGKIEEALQSINDKPLTKCAHCSGKLHKLISHSAFHLKGTGWYVTDYAGKAQNKSKESDGESTPKGAEPGESKSTQTKSAESAD